MNKTLSALAATLMLAMTATPTTTADPGGDDMQTAQNCSFAGKGLIGLGHGLNCNSAVFDVRHWTTDANNTGHRLSTVWAQWVDGVFVSGFEMVVCSDRDDNGVCTNTGVDDFAVTYSNDGVGNDGSTDCNKDEKNCRSNDMDAQRTLCIHADTLAAGGDYDDIVVFIGNWADGGLGGNVGQGVSSGEYEVWLTNGPWLPAC